jgi:hypothetical protein
MHGLREQLLYGPRERQTFTSLEQAITECAKNNPTKREPDKANMVEKKEKKPKCKHCKKMDHKKEECCARTHKSTQCGETGQFKKRCKSEKTTTDSSTPKETSHYAFSVTTRKWVVDTGASSSISSKVKGAKRVDGESLSLADGSTIPTTGSGPVNIGFRISRVLQVPESSTNLLSIGRACEDGDIDAASFGVDGCTIYKNGKAIVSGTRRGGLYLLDEVAESAHVAVSIEIWHRRLARAPTKSIEKIVQDGAVKGIKLKNKSEMVCESCKTGKSTRLPFASRDESRRAKQPGKILHIDLPVRPHADCKHTREAICDANHRPIFTIRYRILLNVKG